MTSLNRKEFNFKLTRGYHRRILTLPKALRLTAALSLEVEVQAAINCVAQAT
jgi:hypothetical protein